MSAKGLMIQGTGSSVGKSLIVTGLCRLFARRGIRVAPFKAQNMSLNSYITEDGLEMGRAQAVQAEAAGIAPSALMNPVLLKPCGDRVSQVLVGGRVRATMDAARYHVFRGSLAGEVLAAYTSLAEQYDLIVIEGAGSPAEINLRENDIANMGMAELADVPVILVGDIERGGVFAALYGTVMLLPRNDRARVRGCVINKFRGEPAILESGLRRLEELLRIPVLGVLPWLNLRIDEEDSLTETPRRAASTPPSVPGDGRNALDIAAIRPSGMIHAADFAMCDMRAEYDRLATTLEACLDMAALERLIPFPLQIQMKNKNCECRETGI